GSQARQTCVTVIQRSAREAADDTATIVASGRTTKAIVAVAVHPFDAQLFARVFFNFDNNGFNQNLRATDIQAFDDSQQRLHGVAVGSEQHRVGVDIKLN